jgi:hypothetical protein
VYLLLPLLARLAQTVATLLLEQAGARLVLVVLRPTVLEMVARSALLVLLAFPTLLEVALPALLVPMPRLELILASIVLPVLILAPALAHVLLAPKTPTPAILARQHVLLVLLVPLLSEKLDLLNAVAALLVLRWLEILALIVRLATTKIVKDRINARSALLVNFLMLKDPQAAILALLVNTNLLLVVAVAASAPEVHSQESAKVLAPSAPRVNSQLLAPLLVNLALLDTMPTNLVLEFVHAVPRALNALALVARVQPCVRLVPSRQNKLRPPALPAPGRPMLPRLELLNVTLVLLLPLSALLRAPHLVVECFSLVSPIFPSFSFLILR